MLIIPGIAISYQKHEKFQIEIYLFNMQDSTVWGPDKYWSIIVNVNDIHLEHGSPPKRWPSFVSDDHCQVEPLVRLKTPASCYKPRVFMYFEGL